MKYAAVFTLFFLLNNLYALKFVTEPFKPFNYADENGNVAGPAKDIIEEACNRSKINCHFMIQPWRRAYQSAKDGFVEGIFSISKRPDREKWMYFSHPIIVTSYGFFILQDNKYKTNELSDFDGYVVSSYGPSNTSKVLTDEIAKKIQIETVIELAPEFAFKNLSSEFRN